VFLLIVVLVLVFFDSAITPLFFINNNIYLTNFLCKYFIFLT
jgi:hypothetical protein